jgi:glycosyltransferase involved in cell wall biosynthesis
MKILVDGLNFELPRGTGIKTYTRSVLTALGELGHSTDLLSQQSVPKVKHVSPLDAYMAVTTSAPSSRRSLGERLLSHIRTVGRSFQGDIDLRANQDSRLLGRLQCEEWRHIDRLRIAPGLFLKSFARAGLGLGISAVPRCRDNEVFFLTSPIPIRLPGRLNILTVHDVIPLSHPWLMDRWSTIAKAVGKTLEYTLAKADKVICVSDVTRQELVTRFKVDERKLHVVYQPCRYSLVAEKPDEESERAVLEALGLSGEPYILFVGAIEPKKNLLNVLKAFELNKKLPQLIVVGPFAWSSSRERAMISGLGGRVRHLGFLPDRELDVLQKHATAFVFPSIVEGFGLPVLEAMWHGVPCVVSDIPVFHELFAGQAVFVDPYDPSSIAAGLYDVTSTKAIGREAMVSFVRERYSLRTFVKGLNDVIQS